MDLVTQAPSKMNKEIIIADLLSRPMLAPMDLQAQIHGQMVVNTALGKILCIAAQ